jgi:hypothetical protein
MKQSKIFFLILPLLAFCVFYFGGFANPLSAKAATVTHLYADDAFSPGYFLPAFVGYLAPDTTYYFTSATTTPIENVCTIDPSNGSFALGITSLGDNYYSFYNGSVVSVNGYPVLAFTLDGVCGTGHYTDDVGSYATWFGQSGTWLDVSDTPIISMAVFLAYPTSTTPDFSNWVVNWSGDVPYGTMTVSYGLSSTTLNYHDSVSFSPFVSAEPLPIHKSQSLWFPPLAIPTTWYAQVADIGATSTVYSDIISFSVDPGAENPASSTITNLAAPFLGVPGTSTTLPTCNYPSSSLFSITGTAPYFQINDPIPYLSASLCGLFIPNADQQNNLKFLFSNLQTTYGKKPPFGYLAAIATPFQSLSISSSSEWPQVVSASTSAEFSVVYGTLDSGLATVVYILLGVWVFHKARTIQL